MKALLLISTLILSAAAHCETKDQWVCTDDATTRQGDTWFACGVGEGLDEGSARERALTHALDEFRSLCKLSTGCDERERSVEPRRTTCSSEAGWWKCYRMVQITLH